jgi:hypothetical protein
VVGCTPFRLRPRFVAAAAAAADWPPSTVAPTRNQSKIIASIALTSHIGTAVIQAKTASVYERKNHQLLKGHTSFLRSSRRLSCRLLAFACTKRRRGYNPSCTQKKPSNAATAHVLEQRSFKPKEASVYERENHQLQNGHTSFLRGRLRHRRRILAYAFACTKKII